MYYFELGSERVKEARYGTVECQWSLQHRTTTSRDVRFSPGEKHTWPHDDAWHHKKGAEQNWRKSLHPVTVGLHVTNLSGKYIRATGGAVVWGLLGVPPGTASWRDSARRRWPPPEAAGWPQPWPGTWRCRPRRQETHSRTVPWSENSARQNC